MGIDILIEVAIEELIKESNVKPPKGEIWYDKNGKVICHICGKSFNKLSSHLVQQHNINAHDYKEIFELKRTAKLTSKTMQEYFKNKPRKDITQYSHKTRFKEGKQSVLKGKKQRLQTILERPTEYKKRGTNE